jgi:hypothetical protein
MPVGLPLLQKRIIENVEKWHIKYILGKVIPKI